MKMLFITICSLLLLASSFAKPKDDDLIVKTEYGLVKGIKNITVEKQIEYLAFRGIPFALPPVGELRFQAPRPPQPWKGILDATHDKTMCVQGFLPVIGVEDCLYLNVYVPKIKSLTKLPVMVWIYGGGFFLGDSLYTTFGPDYFLDQEVIVVTLNYRIGIFGFISTNDLVAPGNAGLKDQNLALKWVKNNIANFGGDPDKITIFGESAGAASVSYHLQSDKSKGLFSGAIMQSGTSLCLWSLSRLASKAAFQVGRTLNLNTTNSESLIKDLKTVDFRLLQLISFLTFGTLIIENNPRSGLIFVPVIEPEHEDAFFTGKSYDMFEKGNFAQVPTIIGYNSLEGNVMLTFPLMLYFERYDVRVQDLVPVDMNVKNSTIATDIGLRIKEKYFNFLPIAFSEASTVDFISDDQFERPIHKTMRLISEYMNVFCYRFSYEGDLGAAGGKMLDGVQHGEDLGYFWRKNNEDDDANDSDRLTRSRVVKLWTNFAKYRNPTPEQDSLLGNVNWPIYKTKNNANVNCLDIGKNLNIAVNPSIKVIDFYEEIYQQYGVPPYDTY